MSVGSSSVDPQFFGKDSFVPFIGQVEDVNDPKRSNRVRVRCLGWHPATKGQNGQGGEEEDALETKDLPWAKVGMPTTMSMQARTGGKHGLRVGSWVFGFFVDGYDAQQPFILSTFSFTSRTTEKDNRVKINAPDGTDPPESQAFGKKDDIDQSSSGRILEDEVNGQKSDTDKSSDQTPDDSTDGKCPTTRSAATKLKEGKKTTASPSGQNYQPDLGDGLCGAAQGARDKVAKIFEEMFPPQLSRFSFDDQVWDTLSGRYINLNGVFNKMSVEISNLMRAPIQSEKGNIEKMLNKALHSTGIFGAATRDEITAITTDFALSSAGDIWHTSFNKMIQELGPQVMQSIQNLDAQEIFDVASMSLADSVITDVSDNFQKVLGDATKTRDESASEGEEYVVEMKGKIDSTTTEDYESDTQVQTAFEGEEGFGVDVLTSGTDFFGESEEEEGGAGFLSMLTDFEFLQNPKLFNKAGLTGVLDMVTQGGCQAQSLFSTEQGLMGSMAGVGGDVTGGGSESGKSSKVDDFVKKNIGFGGLPQNEEFTPTTESQEDAQTQKIPDRERKDTLSLSKSWGQVDLHEPGRTYVLSGEQLIDGKQSDNSRVLVDNQDNPSENGIYITSNGDWERSKDANQPSHFKTDKYVTIPKPNIEDQYYVYTGINNPRVDNQPITFTRLFYK
jgi:hypothetical protein